MDKQAYFKMMGLCKDQALKLPKGTLSRIGGAILGAGKAAVPVGTATIGTIAMNQAHKLGAQRGAAQARNQMADKATAAYNRGLQQGAANKASQPGYWQQLLDYIQGLFK